MTNTPPRTLLAPTTPAPATCADTRLVPDGANLDLVRSAVICLVNQLRARAGLSALVESPALDSTAQGHSFDMVAENYFDTLRPTDSDHLRGVMPAGIAPAAGLYDVGETIAAGSGSLATPTAIVATLMTSTGSTDNPILDPSFREIGSGIAVGVPAVLGLGSPGATYTQEFATTDHP
ncbi:MAG TPA: CAP domain-containing protein [Solirubrobacteraceae bacterium]|nr:CAP domain-containing protein [Solirubrobacteraceae bacterium]